MGNSQSTSQKVSQIIENYTQANAMASSSNQCDQEITVDLRDAAIINCGGAEMKQQCSSSSNATLDTILKALQSATLDSESTQAAEGLALSVNVSKNDNNMRAKTLNQLVANCHSNANNVMVQRNHYDMRGLLMDCTENPDANVLNITQYGDATASCVVKQIVDSQQQNTGTSKTSQKNIGLKLPDIGACIGVIALIILAPALIPGLSGKKSGKFNAELKALSK